MSAFTNGLPDVVAGSTVQARMSMTLPADMSLAGAYAKWELLDGQSHLWNSGDCDAVQSENSQINPMEMIVTAEADIAVPGNLPANEVGTRYQIRYTLFVGTQKLYAFEQFTVTAPVRIAVGASDSVELVGDKMRTMLNLPVAYTNVFYEVYQGNKRVVEPRTAGAPETTQDGVTYIGIVDPTEITSATLDPYTVVWSYWNNVNDPRSRESANLFVVNPIMLDTVREVEAFINRAYVDSGISPGTTFDTADIIAYMRIGRDQFNAAVKPTSITMVNAFGPFKFFWLGYSVVAACRAQYLAEGMKAFNFGGQDVTLDVDRTQYWEQMASAMEAQLNEQIKPFKDNLYKRGIIDGDGSNLALRVGAVGHVGVTLHGASPMRGGFGLGTFNNGFPFIR